MAGCRIGRSRPHCPLGRALVRLGLPPLDAGLLDGVDDVLQQVLLRRELLLHVAQLREGDLADIDREALREVEAPARGTDPAGSTPSDRSPGCRPPASRLSDIRRRGVGNVTARFVGLRSNSCGRLPRGRAGHVAGVRDHRLAGPHRVLVDVDDHDVGRAELEEPVVVVADPGDDLRDQLLVEGQVRDHREARLDLARTCSRPRSGRCAPGRSCC